jgi:hypothetical protein
MPSQAEVVGKPTHVRAVARTHQLLGGGRDRTGVEAAATAGVVAESAGTGGLRLRTNDERCLGR